MENYLYECIHDILRSSTPQKDRLPALNRYKSKIVKLNNDRLKTVMLDNDENDRIDDEEPSFFHVLKMQKRRATRSISLKKVPV